MAKRPVPRYDFKAFGAAIKAARNECGEEARKKGKRRVIYFAALPCEHRETRDNSRVYRYSMTL